MGSQRVRNAAQHVVRNGLAYSSACIVLFGASVFLFTPKTEIAAQYGDFLAGFAAALAFLWLVAGFRQQTKELILQRCELEMQRKAIEEQSAALRDTYQVELFRICLSEIQLFESGLAKLENGPIQLSDLSILLLRQMKDWKIFLESNDPDEVFKKYDEILPCLLAAKGYISRFSAVIVQLEKYLEEKPVKHEDEVVFVMWNAPKLRKVPLLSGYSGIAEAIAGQLYRLEPGHMAVSLAGACASCIVTGTQVFKAEYIDEMKDYLVEREIKLPPLVGVYDAKFNSG